MRDHESRQGVEPAVETLAELARCRLGEMSDMQKARGLQRMVANLHQAGDRAIQVRKQRIVFAAAGAVMALGLFALVVGPRWLGGKPLAYAVSQGQIQAGGYFQIGPNHQPTIQFSDGTKVGLMANARGRIASVDAHGARVILDEGEAEVEVVPRSGARWQFDAGPFVVHVQGTEFGLAWKSGEGRLDLRLRRGAVTVTGPLSDEAIALRPGQWLTVRLAAREVFVREIDHEPEATLPSEEPASVAQPASIQAVPTEAPAAPVASPVTNTRVKARRPARPARVAQAQGDDNWAPARAAGDWNRVLELATKRGLHRTLSERSSDDLALLADAAHYVRRDDVAEQALLAQRERFAGSTRAKDAAFLLGRIVESKPNGARRALDWYDRHLEEAPEGTYASEALGRKMTVLARLRGDAAARPVAEEYLRRYPSGTYARAARAYTK